MRRRPQMQIVFTISDSAMSGQLHVLIMLSRRFSLGAATNDCQKS